MSSSIAPDNILYLPEGIDLRICPKNAFSSLKAFYLQLSKMLEPTNRVERAQREFAHVRGGPASWRQLQVLKYGNHYDLPFRFDSVRFAVKRDPIERFKSAVEMLQLQSKSNYATIEDIPLINKDYSAYSSVKLLLDDLYGGKVSNVHFWTQTQYMGSTKNYDYVYDVKEMEKLYSHILSFYGIDYDKKVWYTHKNISNNSDYDTTQELLLSLCPTDEQYLQQISYMDYYKRVDKSSRITELMTPNDYARVKKLYKIDYDNGWY